MIAILFALTALVGWGTADIFGGLVARKIGGYSSAVWSYILSMVIATLYVPFAIPELTKITLETAVWLVVLIPIGVIPLLSLYEGIKVGNASLVGTIAGSFGGLVVILSVIFLGERISLIQVFSVVVIFVGLLLSSFDFMNSNLKKLLSDKGIPFALVSLVTWGVYFTFVKIPIRNIGWFWPAYISWAGFPLVLLFMKAKSIKFELPTGRKNIVFMTINVLLLTAALFAYNLAAANGQTAVVAPIASSYPVLFAVLAYFVFKDRLKMQQIAGVVTALAGIILLSFLA
ncbi:MAG: DMT family transporter [Patescibacteria group bacterium]|jgi:drug/metabolite transporter (DMT)-like permease